MRHSVTLGILAVASPLEVGAGEAGALAEKLRAAFAAAELPGLKVHVLAEPVVSADRAVEAGRLLADQRVDALCIIAASWFEDYLVLDLLEECPAPVILWARPGMETGSLCGMQQLGYMLKQLARPSCFLFFPPGEPSALQRAWTYASAAALRARLRRARIGLLGHRVEGMTETTAHEVALKKTLGPRLVSLDTQVFLERAAGIAPQTLSEGWERLIRRVGQVTATQEAGISSLQVYIALKEVVGEGGLAAVAVGCYPHLMGKVCLAASLLGEEGIPIACEGDVNGAVGMVMLTQLSGAPIHNTDLLDPVGEELVLSHCGSGGFSLAADVRQINLAPVRLMNRGLCCLFTAKPGPVTLLNITATLSGYRLAVLHGQAVETEMVFPGNPLRVRFQGKVADTLAWIAAEGLGHHWMAAYGDWRASLRDLAVMTGCEWLEKE